MGSVDKEMSMVKPSPIRAHEYDAPLQDIFLPPGSLIKSLASD